MAYQLADDILDASGNEEISGKTGRDEQRGKQRLSLKAPHRIRLTTYLVN